MLPCFLSFALLWNLLILPWPLLTLSISGCFHQGEKVYFSSINLISFLPCRSNPQKLVQLLLQVVSLKSIFPCNVSTSPLQGTACRTGTFAFHCSHCLPSLPHFHVSPYLISTSGPHSLQNALQLTTQKMSCFHWILWCNVKKHSCGPRQILTVGEIKHVFSLLIC